MGQVHCVSWTLGSWDSWISFCSSCVIRILDVEFAFWRFVGFALSRWVVNCRDLLCGIWLCVVSLSVVFEQRGRSSAVGRLLGCGNLNWVGRYGVTMVYGIGDGALDDGCAVC